MSLFLKGGLYDCHCGLNVPGFNRCCVRCNGRPTKTLPTSVVHRPVHALHRVGSFVTISGRQYEIDRCNEGTTPATYTVVDCETLQVIGGVEEASLVACPIPEAPAPKARKPRAPTTKTVRQPRRNTVKTFEAFLAGIEPHQPSYGEEQQRIIQEVVAAAATAAFNEMYPRCFCGCSEGDASGNYKDGVNEFLAKLRTKLDESAELFDNGGLRNAKS
jgi:hypothetical protein